MNSWFRLHAAMLNNRKVQSLPDKLFKFWVNLLCLAVAHDGDVPPDEDIAFGLRISAAEAGKRTAELIAARLVDDLPDGRRIHDWDDHQFKSDSPNERVKRYRERRKQQQGNVSGPPDVTLHETLHETDRGNVTVTPPEQSRADTETEQRQSGNVSPAYAWEGKTIRLTQADYEQWRRSYHRADIDAELQAADDYYTRKPPRDGKWFIAASRWLKRAHDDAKPQVGTTDGGGWDGVIR